VRTASNHIQCTMVLKRLLVQIVLVCAEFMLSLVKSVESDKILLSYDVDSLMRDKARQHQYNITVKNKCESLVDPLDDVNIRT